jgi:protein-tyrosine phosphatase
MIDIHTHILPNVDDGSDSIETSIEMLKDAKEQGVTHIILTPHAILNSSTYLSKEELQTKYDEFIKKIEDIGIKVYLGSEIYYTEKSYKKLLKNELKTINDSKYFIMEFPMHHHTDIDEIMYDAKIKGFNPILAHPERYNFLKVDDVASIKQNALIQVNTTSILGNHGRSIKKFAFELMKNNLVDFVSSDCHNPHERNVNLEKTYKIVSKKFGKNYADKIFRINQEKLIEEIDK